MKGVQVWDRTSGKEYELGGDIVVNATGAWAGEIAAMAKASVPVIPTPGVMVAYNQRVTNRVINRLNEPGDGDIIIPQRRMAVIGTTSFEVQDVDYIPVFEDQVQQMNARGVRAAAGPQAGPPARRVYVGPAFDQQRDRGAQPLAHLQML